MKGYPSPPPLFSVRVRVPASAANLGPGFDTLGLALSLYNELEVSVWDIPGLLPLTVNAKGEGKESLPMDKTNLVCQVVYKTLKRLKKNVTSVRVELNNHIPLARGLGSSSSAIVGAITAVNVGMGTPLSFNEVLNMAVKEEGHPDNVVPCLEGGLSSSVLTNEVSHVAWKDKALFENLKAVVCVPSFHLKTVTARKVLPKSVSHRNAVYNVSRVALFLSAFKERQFHFFKEAMKDRLHQPFREKKVVGLTKAIEAACQHGAYGASLSGAGPSVLALAPARHAGSVGKAMKNVFRQHSIPSEWMNLSVDLHGAKVLKKKIKGS